MRQPDFDLDFRRGQQGELFAERIIEGLRGGLVEVKRDDAAIQTGRLYIETDCRTARMAGMYEPSGIRVSKADFWAYVVGEGLIVVPTQLLRDILPGLSSASCPRGSNPTKGAVIPIGTLWNMIRARAREESQQAMLPGLSTPTPS